MACSTAGKLHICKDEKSFVTNTVTGINISIICKCLKAAEIKESIRGEASAGEPRKWGSVGDQEIISSLMNKNVFQ